MSSALLAGAAAGLIAGLLQLFFVQPVLQHAELYESGALTHFGAGALAPQPEAPTHQHLAPPELVRSGLSILFTVLTFCGYALLLVAAMALAQHRGASIDGRTGVLWGIAGFVAVQLAPGFTLAPEVPGSAAGDLAGRQIWWFATVAASAAALWLLAFGRGWPAWGAAALLLLAPHLVGAPEPEAFAGTSPPEIAALFAARALGTGMAAWAILGSLAGYLWDREGLTSSRQDATRRASGQPG